MALPYLSVPGYIGVSDTESAYASPATITRWARPLSRPTLKETIDNQAQPDLSVDTPDTAADLFDYQAGTSVAGEIVGKAAYNDRAFITLLYHALGAKATAGVGVSYTHTISPAKLLPTGLTVEVGDKDKAENFAGCKVNQFELTWETGQIAQWRASLIGSNGANLSAVGSPTYDVTTNADYILHTDVGTLAWNSLTLSIKRLRLHIDNKLQTRPALGSLTTLEPVRSAPPEYTLEVVCERTAVSLHDAYRARTASDCTITITRDSINRIFAIALNNAKIWDLTSAANGRVIEDSFTLRGFRDTATEKGLSIAITNANATAV